MTENFRAKLGWLVGQLYSRVGTEDYVPGALANSSEFNNYIAEILAQHVVWVPQNLYSGFKKEVKENSPQQALETATESVTEARERKFLNLASRMIKEVDTLDESSKVGLMEFFKSQQGLKLIKDIQ